VKLISSSPEATEEIGFKIGGKLRATMVKGIARAMGIDRKDITSASFTIIAEYPTTPPFFHIDLYRTSGGADLESTGIWDCIGNHSISVIEWPEHAEGELPDNSLKIIIKDAGNNLREIIIEGGNEKDWDYL